MGATSSSANGSMMHAGISRAPLRQGYLGIATLPLRAGRIGNSPAAGVTAPAGRRGRVNALILNTPGMNSGITNGGMSADDAVSSPTLAGEPVGASSQRVIPPSSASFPDRAPGGAPLLRVASAAPVRDRRLAGWTAHGLSLRDLAPHRRVPQARSRCLTHHVHSARPTPSGSALGIGFPM